MYKINVLVVTYCQESVIGRTLESILCQKEWGLNNIVICDDCSTDGTWKVLQEYVQRYPDIIKAYRNETNLGIYGNTQRVFSLRGKADLYTDLAGDDALVDGWFKEIQQYLNNNNIILHDIAATICSDYKILKPNGTGFVSRVNRLVRKDVDLVSLKSRSILTVRSTMVTKSTIDKYPPIILDRGLSISESMADMRPFLYSDKFFYVPYVASIYYSRIGVSKKMNNDSFYKDKFDEILDFYDWEKKYYRLNAKALNYIDYSISRCTFHIEPTWKHFKEMTKLYIKAFDRYTWYDTRFMLEMLNWIRMAKLLLIKK